MKHNCLQCQLACSLQWSNYQWLEYQLSNNDNYYINTNEIPGELSRKNMISSHVKITCYLHM